MNQSSSSPKDLFSEDWRWQPRWATSVLSDLLRVKAVSQIKVGVGIGVREGSDCRLRDQHIQCCYILPGEEDLSLCQAGNSKCLALKVFPALTSAMEEETALSEGLWGPGV